MIPPFVCGRPTGDFLRGGRGGHELGPQGPEGQAMWHDLLVASALVLVLEGIWPFLSPSGSRRAMLSLAEADDPTLRLLGLISMVFGVVLLYLVN